LLFQQRFELGKRRVGRRIKVEIGPPKASAGLIFMTVRWRAAAEAGLRSLRGRLVFERGADTTPLADALENKKIAGAGLDVYEHEPKVNPKLMARQDVILAPHIGSATVETRTRMMVVAADNVAAFFEGRTPPSAINKDALGLK